MKEKTTNLLGKILYDRRIAETLARHKTSASNPRLLQDLIRFGPSEKQNPAHKLEEWRTIALLATELEHNPESELNLGHLLKPGEKSEKFLQLLQKASGTRAAKLIAQQRKNFKKDKEINLYWVALALLNWSTQKKETWVRWAKAYYITEGEEA
jgi:hypothetical protein